MDNIYTELLNNMITMSEIKISLKFRNKDFYKWIIWSLILLLLAGCSSSDLDKDGNPKVFQVTLFTSSEDNPQELVRGMEPMRLYLEKELTTPVRLIPVTGYSTVIEALKAKKIHMAQLSAYPYLLGRKRANITALFCMGKNDGSLTDDYKSCIITRKSSGLKTLDDLKANISNLIIAFVDPASSSGYIVPHYYLVQNGIDSEKNFKKVLFTGNHPAAIMTLTSGKVDVACAELSTIVQINKLFKNESPDNFNFIWISPPIPPVPYCIRNDINPAFRKKVLEAFINMKKDTAAWGATKRNRVIRMLTTYPIDSLRYIPVKENMFDEFEKMVKSIKNLNMK
jgi:phosphonate transport system substrate-binding protein